MLLLAAPRQAGAHRRDVERVSDEDADAYFATRPRESQLGAWASKQSSALDSRATLEQQLDETRARFDGHAVTRPPYWSGYRVVPNAIEFWTRDAARLHVRERYRRTGNDWIETLVFPTMRTLTGRSSRTCDPRRHSDTQRRHRVDISGTRCHLPLISRRCFQNDALLPTSIWLRACLIADAGRA